MQSSVRGCDNDRKRYSFLDEAYRCGKRKMNVAIQGDSTQEIIE
jgi:hypothetical protein